MQTFMPFPDFALTACCLDDDRLNKVRFEALAIYRVLRGEQKAEPHPAIEMWRGYDPLLAWYYNIMLSTWKHRGHSNGNLERIPNTGFPIIFPPWIGNREFHRSHQSNLLRKNENHYRLWFGYSVPKNLGYIWPVERRALLR